MDEHAYASLQKKYGLPDFHVLDVEFEISSIEEEGLILRGVCKKIRERIEVVIDVIEHVLQPDTNSYIDMYECKFFSGSEKDSLFVLLKHVMHSYRSLLEVEIVQDEKLYAQFIKDFFGEWQNLKKSLLPFFSKLKAVWKETKQDKAKLEYLG